MTIRASAGCLSGHCRLLWLMAVLTVINGCAVSGSAQVSNGEQSVQLYLDERPATDIPAFTGVVTIEGSMHEVMSVLADISGWPDWVYGCRYAELIHAVSFTEGYLYQVIDLPLVTDRDALIHSTLSASGSGDEITIHIEAAPQFCDGKDLPGCRRPNQSDLVRINQLTGSFHLEQLEPGRVEVTWRQHVDPGGNIPNWITRMMLSRVPRESLQQLKERVEQR